MMDGSEDSRQSQSNREAADDTPSSFEKQTIPFHAPDLAGGAVRTLDGEIAGDEFAQDAINYQILLGKVDRLLDNLRLDA